VGAGADLLFDPELELPTAVKWVAGMIWLVERNSAMGSIPIADARSRPGLIVRVRALSVGP
jgi:hypothetical protein